MKITISGDRNSGKTTLAKAIWVWLTNIGYDVTYVGCNETMNSRFKEIGPPSPLEKREVIIEDKI